MRIWDVVNIIKEKSNKCDICKKNPIYRTLLPNDTQGKTNRPWRLCLICLNKNSHLLFNNKISNIINKVNQIRKEKDPLFTPLNLDGTFLADNNVKKEKSKFINNNSIFDNIIKNLW